MYTKFLSENLKGKDHMEDLDIDRKTFRIDLRGIG
jgi:hypothetical protein